MTEKSIFVQIQKFRKKHSFPIWPFLPKFENRAKVDIFDHTEIWTVYPTIQSRMSFPLHHSTQLKFSRFYANIDTNQ